MNTLVSICCTTYNHSKYIRDTLEGFLMQKTDFEFEIIIHDDASNDSTLEIIREYEKLYPSIIRIISQNTNKYSLGENIYANYLWPNVRGKYISLCEGDDYWSDSQKLQRQVDYIEKNPECSMVSHAVRIVKEDKAPTGKILRYSKENTICLTNELIENSGQLTQTSSYLFRRGLIKEFPNWDLDSRVGDYLLVILMASKGEVYYINSIMSCYRIGVNGSWTNRLHTGNKILENKLKEYKNKINILRKFDDETSNLYSTQINIAIEPIEFRVAFLEGKYKELRADKYMSYKKRVGFINIYKVYIKNIFIKLFAFYMKIVFYVKKI